MSHRSPIGAMLSNLFQASGEQWSLVSHSSPLHDYQADRQSDRLQHCINRPFSILMANLQAHRSSLAGRFTVHPHHASVGGSVCMLLYRCHVRRLPDAAELRCAIYRPPILPRLVGTGNDSRRHHHHSHGHQALLCSNWGSLHGQSYHQALVCHYSRRCHCESSFGMYLLVR